MAKKKENNGSLCSCIGGFVTRIGITLLAMQSSALVYLSCTIIGLILAAYGVFLMLKKMDN
jgi:hypothetical protein